MSAKARALPGAPVSPVRPLGFGLRISGLIFVLCLMFATSAPSAETIRLITLDPGHFHAGLVQKFMYPQVSPDVHVYAPAGPDVQEHLQRVESFNKRADNPTHWQENVCTGPDFLER